MLTTLIFLVFIALCVYAGALLRCSQQEVQRLRTAIVQATSQQIDYKRFLENTQDRFGRQIFTKLCGLIEERFPCDHKGRLIKVERGQTKHGKDAMYIFISDALSNWSGSPTSSGYPIATLTKHVWENDSAITVQHSSTHEVFAFPVNVYGANKAIALVLEFVEQRSLRHH